MMNKPTETVIGYRDEYNRPTTAENAVYEEVRISRVVPRSNSIFAHPCQWREHQEVNYVIRPLRR